MKKLLLSIALTIPFATIAAPASSKSASAASAPSAFSTNIWADLPKQIETITQSSKLPTSAFTLIAMFDSIISFELSDKAKKMLETTADQSLSDQARSEILQQVVLEIAQGKLIANEVALPSLDKLVKKGLNFLLIFPSFDVMPIDTAKKLTDKWPLPKRFTGKAFEVKIDGKVVATFAQGTIFIDISQNPRIDEIIEIVCKQLKLDSKNILYIQQAQMDPNAQPAGN